MPAADIKPLRFGDMVFNRRGSLVRRFIHAIVSISLRLFFRRIETLNVTDVPYKGPLIFVMNHPNGLIDPSLVFVALPRKVSFLAKSTLFKIPILSRLLQIVEALPVYRRIDSADVTQNTMTFEASHHLLSSGGAIALFPEGISHNSPKLLPIKTGAARIALGAISGFGREEKIDLKIIPVGIYYTSKTNFRSEALLYFGDPINVEPVSLEEDGDLPREPVKELTDRIEEALLEVTVNAETGSDIETASEAANLFLSASETLDLEESLAARFEFVRKFLNSGSEDGEKNFESEQITKQISEYKKKLRDLGLEPENLSLSKHPFIYVFQHFVFRILILGIFLPFSILGFLLHLPAYHMGKFLGARYTKHGVDDIVSTVKIISGIITMPLTWMLTALIIAFFWDWKAALLSLPVAVICGYAAMRSIEELTDLRGWFRSILLLLRKRELFIELLLERRGLYKRLSSFN